MQFFYRVRHGDTLYQIAKRWGISVASLVAANHLLPPYTIYTRQQLSIPPGVNRVRVKQGETVYKIAQAFGIPASVIIEANQLKPPYEIQMGQLLMVPPGVPYYVVQPGDTLFQLANRYNVRTGGEPNTEFIRQINQLPNTTLYIGMRLVIPYAPTGDKGKISYTASQGGKYDLWIHNSSDGGNRALTNQLGDSFSSPEWSPNSKYIAFVGKNRTIYVVHIQTGAISQIYQLSENDSIKIDWSPDSQKIAFTKQGQIIIYNVQTHQNNRLSAIGATDIQWFPNGKELLFQAPDASGISQIFRMIIDGTGKSQITRNTDGPLHNIKLSPDGSYVLYTTPGASISIIYTVNLLSGQLYEIKGGPFAKNYYPEWSPDSLSIAYSTTVFDDRGYYSQIRTVGRSGEDDRIWAISSCFSTPVTWSPDGESMAYLSGCIEQEQAKEIWIINLTHPVPIRIVKDGSILSLQWSPKEQLSYSTYTNSVFKVKFFYPSHWQKVSDTRYEGPDGFFLIAAISSGESIQSVCQGETSHLLKPYGTMPRIINVTLQNQEACYIYPSSDQPAEMKNQAAFIVKYPNPVQVQGVTYNFFILWADEKHIQQISSTLILI